MEIPINQYPDNNDLFPCAVLLHEIFHLLIRKNKILKKQIYNLNKNSPYFEELLISSFIPEGYLSQVYLNTPQLKYSKNSKNLIDQRRYIAHKLSDQAQTYIKKKQPLDKKYFNLIKSTI